jgi:hypothetical protein
MVTGKMGWLDEIKIELPYRLAQRLLYQSDVLWCLPSSTNHLPKGIQAGGGVGQLEPHNLRGTQQMHCAEMKSLLLQTDSAPGVNPIPNSGSGSESQLYFHSTTFLLQRSEHVGGTCNKGARNWVKQTMGSQDQNKVEYHQPRSRKKVSFKTGAQHGTTSSLKCITIRH